MLKGNGPTSISEMKKIAGLLEDCYGAVET
jgi:hypothetical protein